MSGSVRRTSTCVHCGDAIERWRDTWRHTSTYDERCRPKTFATPAANDGSYVLRDRFRDGRDSYDEKEETDGSRE